MKLIKLSKHKIFALTDKEIIDIAISLGIQLKLYANELEPGKYIITKNEQLREYVNAVRVELITVRADKRAMYALIISILTALAAILNTILNWGENLKS